MKSPILLDTCAAIYIMEDQWMRDGAVTVIDDAYDRGEKIFVSAVTAWEIGMLAAKSRVKLSQDPKRWFERLLSRQEVGLAKTSPNVLLDSSFLPGSIQGDPADRIIAATAREYGFTVMTRDRALLDYALEGHLSVLEC